MSIKLHADVTMAEFDDRIVLFSKKTGDFYTLNDSGASFFQYSLKYSVDETVARIAKEYDAEEKLIREDLTDFILDLKNRGFIIQDCSL